MSGLFFILFALTAYLIGSVCSAIIVCKLFNLPDPRTHGSNNPGATNMLRIAGKWAALLVLLGDVLKGTLPVILAKVCGLSPQALAWIGLAAIVGHVYPVFFGFKGGKGVATTLGALLGYHLSLAGTVVGTWILVASVTGYSSLASLLAIGLMPGFAYLQGHSAAELPLCLIALLIGYQHQHNITRLMRGTESKIKLRR